MNLYYILDENKNVIPAKDIFDWAEFFESKDKIVEQTKIGTSLISTVFLGLDYDILGEKPELFETMVFDGDKSGDLYARYSTYKEALEGHKRAIEEITKKLKANQ